MRRVGVYIVALVILCSSGVGLAGLPKPSGVVEQGAVIALVPVDTCDSAAFFAETLPTVSIADTGEATDGIDLDSAGVCAGGGTQFAGTGTGPEYIYGLRVDRNCQLRLTLQSNGSADHALYVITNCDDVTGSCLAVEDGASAGGSESITLSATTGTYYLAVIDGNQGSSGPYEFTVSEVGATGCRLIGLSECGNGNIEPGEDCDDGNKADGDGCSAECKQEADMPDAGPTPADAGSMMADAGSAMMDARASTDAGMASDAGSGDTVIDAGSDGPTTPVEDGDDDDGCGCRAGLSGGDSPTGLLLAAAMLWLALRSRVRRY